MKGKVPIDEERPLPEWLLKLEKKRQEEKARSASTATNRRKKKKHGNAAVLPGTAIIEKSAVDYRNVPKAWKRPEAVEEEERLEAKRRETSRQEAMKPFPYGVRPTPVSQNSAVAKYAQARGSLKVFLAPDNEVHPPEAPLDDILPYEEEVAPQNTIDKDDALVERLLQPTLHVDQSKLPLEMFDSFEFIEKDKTPQEWLASDNPVAFVAYYDGMAFNTENDASASWRWRRCKVLQYDSVSRQFKVKLGTRTKFVSRLNIRFAQEDETLWLKRRESAFNARDQTKRQLRLNAYLKNEGSTAPVQPNTLRAIHSRLALSRRERRKNSISTQQRELTTEAIRAYDQAMAMAAARHRYESQSSFRNEYNGLDLPLTAVAPRPSAPYRAKLALPTHNFDEHRSKVQNLHFSQCEPVLNVLVWLRVTWEASMAHKRFVLVPDMFLHSTAAATTDENCGQRQKLTSSQTQRKEKCFSLPCDLNEFGKIQQKHCQDFETLLHNDWRRAFVEQIVDHVQEVHDFFASDLTTYRNGTLIKLLKHLELRMSTQLSDILIQSLDDWLTFVQRFAGTASVENAIQGLAIPPLFALELRVANQKKVSLEPSPLDIEAALLARVDQPVSAVAGIDAIDNDLMSLLRLPKRPLLAFQKSDTEEDHPLASEIETKVNAARQRIRSVLGEALAGPSALADKYNQFVWIASIDAAAHVRSFVRSEPAPTLEQYVAEVRRFHEAAQAVERLSENCERFPICSIDTTSAKASLSSKANEILAALLQQVVYDVRVENEATVERYEEILNRLAEHPTNEAELAALKIFIAETKTEVLETVEKVDAMRAKLAHFDEFHIPLSKEDTFLALSTMEYPRRVHDASNETEARIELDKVRMIDKLASERSQFDDKLQQFQVDVAKAKEYSDYSKEQAFVEDINRLQDAITEAKKTAQDFNDREQVFGFPPTEYVELNALEDALNPYWDLWNMISDFHTNRHEWLHGAFLDLEGAKIQREVEVWWKQSYKLRGLLEHQENPGAASCAAKLREETTEFRKNLPLIQALASPALKERHWSQLSDKIGHKITPYDDNGVELTLQSLLDMNTNEYISEIEEVCVAAEKEYKLERDLQAMKDEWSLVQYDVKPYKETGTFIVGGIDDIIALLDDHIVKTQTMCGSMFIKAIEEDAKNWEAQLKYGQALLDEWIACQRVWMYLEPIFASEDIMRQLPTEARRFNDVDRLWRATMKATEEDPIFISQADTNKKLKYKFAEANEKLDKIQKGLSDYLETKRLFFPRFFFLADEQMLEILSQTKEPRAVQPHLGKLFEGLNTVQFETDLKISQMISAETERVDLLTAVDPESPANKGHCERWLLELERIQWETVKQQIELALIEYPKMKRSEWTLRWPAQAVLAVSQIFWTQDVTKAIEDGGSAGLVQLVSTLNEQLTSIVMLVRGQLSKLERKTLSALVVMDVHARDTVVSMATNKVEKVNDFNWMSQLRYYWDAAWKDGQAVKKGDDTCVARIINARCLYGYEYLGNSMRLVITPLTDRCYRTMVSAIDLLYGGAPEGPAGTGKTETVKDLSKALAIQCVVFNCSDGLDYKAMGKFFKGLAGCGSWSCFDEFNRISVEVLSVIAQQILTINKAKAAGSEKFYFEGTLMKLKPACQPFITMNPGYAGRAELPDNLKALFRPCAMMVPDYALIGEIRLYSFGFENARINAQKLVRTLQLCSEQLSSQKHYDYGMRAVNSILVAAGNLRLKVGDDPNWDEAKIVLRSVMDVNLPKFTVDDIPLFRGITSDLFPGVELPTADHGALLPTIDEVCWAGVRVAPGESRCHKLEPIDTFTLKIAQLYEMVLVRHGVMVVGQTLSGKTSAIHALSSAMTLCNERGEPFEKVHIHTMNPKSITSGQLYGNFDENTHEWADGILAVTFRTCAEDTSPDRHWLCFDGPVDAVWIENMNTVLDDNKKLCLMSGEIIKQSDRMTMLYEAADLEQASPATVSRVGMIFCSPSDLGWQPFLNIFMANKLVSPFKEHAKSILQLYNWLFPPLTFFVQKMCVIPTPVTTLEHMQSSLRLADCFMNEALLDCSDASLDFAKVIEGLFIQALIWSIGACVDFDSREKFDTYLRLVLSGDREALLGNEAYSDFRAKHPNYNDEFTKMSTSVMPPTNSDGGLSKVHDFRFMAKSASWVAWIDPLSQPYIPPTAEYNSIVVPTVDTVRHDFLIDQLMTRGYHVMATGETGTGKSVSIKSHRLMSGRDDKFAQQIILNFSAQTSANQTQDIIDNKLGKRRKGVYGPPPGTRCAIFVDDANMPMKEIYGAQPPIEILRQWMDHGGWYNRADNTFRQTIDVQFLAAMGPPGGGRTQITQRYVRHFSLLNFVPFNEASLTRIFSTILEWSLSKGYSADIKALSCKVVDATIGIYQAIAHELLPTPMKSFYTFNLRDLSKVFQGLSQANSSEITNSDTFVRLWCHESLRVFHDRLVDEGDTKWFYKQLRRQVETKFGLDFDSTVVPSGAMPIMFGSYLDYNSPAERRMYKEIPNEQVLQGSMSYFLAEYNNTNTKTMSLVLFLNAMEHVSRIARVLSQPNGNALLMGVGGSGRKSLTNLAVFICDYELVQIEISKNYGRNEWVEDLKKIFLKAGADGKQTVFVFDDTQIVHESFLEDINLILNTGEVPNLFSQEDLAAVNEQIGKVAQGAGVNTSVPTEMYKYFISRCRANLHLVICLSPIGEAFRRRLRMFPALVTCCTLDSFSAWPEAALRSVANRFLGAEDLNDKLKSGIVDVCVDMQERVSHMSKRYKEEMGRHFYVTPTSYLELISTFKTLLAKQRAQVTESKLRYDNGLQKILSTEGQIEGMQIELVALQPKLKQATIDTDALLDKIAADKIEANKVEAVVNHERIACNAKALEAEEIKASCQQDLDKALPALEGAIQALKSLKQSDIVEIKAMKKPPDAVKLVLEACCLMMNVKPEKIKDPAGGMKRVDDFWGPAQKHLLGDTKFLQKLLEYDKDNMDPAMVEKVVQYTKKDLFQLDVVKKSSVAAHGLAKWIFAMMVYNKVVKEVAPKRQALAEAEAALQEATALLQEKEASLTAVQEKLKALQSQLDEASAKKQDLQAQVTDCATKLERAEQLIKGLGSEKARWSELSQQLEDRFKNVTGDILLASGVVAYLGAFVVSYRTEAITEWKALLQRKDIYCAEEFSLRSTLGDEVKIREHVISKLPNDEYSIENSIMLEYSNRWPLMIDPQGQANRWIKQLYSNDGLKVVKLSQATFARTIENAISYGCPVLVENVAEVLDPVLEPLLLKQVVKVGGVASIKFGDTMLEYNPNFRLFLTTKLRNPHYAPELCVKVNLLNFMATAEGLEDQMLGLAVACEEAELEAQREKLITEDAANKAALKEIEDKILHLLKNATGNILDDEQLINTLKESKISSTKIEAKVKEAAKTNEIISRTRKRYQSLAFHGAQLFFTVSDLSLIDPMYQYSMEWYQTLFVTAFERTTSNNEGGDQLEIRIKNLKDTFTYLLYQNVCRSLFAKDILLFSFLLCVKIMSGQQRLDATHLRFFLAGNVSLEQRERPLPQTPGNWLSEKSWDDILALGRLTGFEEFVDKFIEQLPLWRGVFESKTPMDALRTIYSEKKNADDVDPYDGRASMHSISRSLMSMGDYYKSSVQDDDANDANNQNGQVDHMMQLCVLRAIRPDTVVPEIQQFVASEMGKKFIEVPQFDLEACYNDSKCFTPLLFVLTPGADPMSELYKLAEKRGFVGKRLHAISLGQGQGDIAYQAVSEAQDKGHWIVLQNAHLCISWMPTLERLCEELSPDRIHSDFRIWLTSEPTPKFPSYVLQNGIKMTLEPPKGMRANLIGSYTSMVTEDFLEGTSRSHEFKKLLFGLCFFHANVRERRKFGPLGWNIKYVFSGSDLRISMDQLRILCNETSDEETIPYAALRYLAGECNYGGRVTDDKDRRCLANILTDFYSEAIVKDEDYKFSPSGIYHAPRDGSLRDYIEFVKALPYTEGPELFGLHDNANISCALGETNQLLGTILSLQSRTTGGADGSTWDRTLSEVSADIEARLPEQFDLEKAVIDFPVRYDESMNTVLTQELLRFNKLTDLLKRTLKEVQRALKGLVVMSGELEHMGDAMVDGLVPEMWSKAAYPSRKPLASWVVDLLARLDFLEAWFQAKIAPNIFWISGFYFTQAFITGTLQNYARKYQLPIDTVAFDFTILTESQSLQAEKIKPGDGSVCRGLFLEGARWDANEHILAESRPRELHTSLPLFHMLPKPKKDIIALSGRPDLYTGEIDGKAHMYNCPVYKESTRQGVLSTTGHSTNFVMFLRVPMASYHTQKHWIKRGTSIFVKFLYNVAYYAGVAMLTQLDN